MYLKRLEIKGFKSFAEKAILDFFPSKNGRNSVTAIVGPNGSGKSNISDAIRWVMGEQSLKNLRGKKSEDVIFGGSENKGQLGAAEVTMVLDNADGRVLNDYAEITITRRLFRSGESEYLLNNSFVRLIDIQLLLAKAQFAQHSYSVISQGTIDRLLMITPTERKDFLDEASGIKEHQIKQHQAQLKLSRTRENVEQAGRLMVEVEPRLKLLSKQVKKLEKRQEVEKSLRENQEQYYASIYLINKEEVDEVTAKLEKIESEYRGIFNDLERTQKELASLAKESTRQDVFGALQNKHQSLLRVKNDLERQLAIKDGQMQAEYGKEGKSNICWTENKIAELQLEGEGMLAQVDYLKESLIKLDREEKEARIILEQFIKDKQQSQTKIIGLEQQIISAQTEQNFRQYSGLAAAQAILEKKNQFGRVYGLVAELGEVEEQYRLALEVAAGSFLSAIVVDTEETARLAIEYLRNSKLGSATFLPLNKIVSRPEDLEGIKRLSVEPGVLGAAVNFVKHDEKFSAVFSFIFGNTLLVDNLVAAKKVGVGRARMITLDGDLVEKSGVMKGGYRYIKKNSIGFSKRMPWNKDDMSEWQSEISLERGRLVLLEQQIEKAQTKVAILAAEKEKTATKKELISAQRDNISQNIVSLRQDLSLHTANPDEFSKILFHLGEEKKVLLGQINKMEIDIRVAQDKLARFNEDEESKKQKVFSLQEEMQKKQNNLNDILATRSEMKIQMARLETKQNSLAEEAQLETSASIISIIARQPPLTCNDELPRIADNIQKLKYQLSLIGGIDEDVVDEHKQTKEKYEFLTSQIDDLTAAIGDLEKMVVELDEIMKKQRAMAFKKIRSEFGRYVKILFGGGSGEMKEIYGEEAEIDESSVDNETILEDESAGLKRKKSREKVLTGIDIAINPPGKKIKNVNTLSGGERTLASIALICAVLNCNPAPFVVLDEVEAALDETNTQRFAQIVGELSSQSQFVIITHNRVTMHSADVLYGVVMNGDGVSRLLSVKLGEAEAIAADSDK